MRSDFLGDCTQFPGLAEKINAGQYLVPRMTREERRAAIGGPVGSGRGREFPCVTDAPGQRRGRQPGPTVDPPTRLKSHLEPVGAFGRQRAIDLQHYEAIGTMAQALDQHAERAYAELATARQQQICEKLFKALTDKATDSARRTTPDHAGHIVRLAAATPAEVRDVIDVFRNQAGSDLQGDLA